MIQIDRPLKNQNLVAANSKLGLKMEILVLQEELIRTAENPVVRGGKRLAPKELGCEIHQTKIADVYPPMMLLIKMERSVKCERLHASRRYRLFFRRGSLRHFESIRDSRHIVIVCAGRIGQLPSRCKPIWRSKTIGTCLVRRSVLHESTSVRRCVDRGGWMLSTGIGIRLNVIY